MRRNTGDILEVLVNNIEKILVLTSERVKNQNKECLSSELRKLKCVEKVVGKYQVHNSENFR